MKKIFFNFLTIFFFSSFIYSSPLQLEYYGVISSSQDSKMMKMAQDLFFTQLNSIDNLSIQDKRSDVSTVAESLPDTSSVLPPKIIFFAEIRENKTDIDNVVWNCKFNIKTPVDGKIYFKEKEYDSYYKMLMSSKDIIDELLKPFKLSANKNDDSPSGSVINIENNSLPTIEKLSGTWNGESYIDKIVILRGGRGFIIFKNGASMNISVSVSENTVTVKQIGKNNASYYPDISRETALKEALTAPPIQWNFTYSDNKLTGTKKTLTYTDENKSNVTWGSVKSNWQKKE